MVRAMLDGKHFDQLVKMVDNMIRHNNNDEVEQEVQNFFMGMGLECPMPWAAVKEFVQERQFNAVIDSWLERG